MWINSLQIILLRGIRRMAVTQAGGITWKQGLGNTARLISHSLTHSLVGLYIPILRRPKLTLSSPNLLSIITQQ